MDRVADKYMNPYLAGVLLGLVLLLTIFITGRGLGASGALKSAMVYVVETVAPSHVENTQYYSDYMDSHVGSPLRNWLVFEVVGIIFGGFISGLISNRLKFKIEKGSRISSKTRLIAALSGGALFGIGAQFGRGCTSGAALSGMAVFSTGGFITMFAIFGTGYALAFFARKLWI
jgi:uncharacterized protein